MCDNPTILNLHLLFMGFSYRRLECQAAITQRKAEEQVAVTHLALLGVKIVGNGILGITEENVYGTRKIFRVQKILKIQKRTYAKDK